MSKILAVFGGTGKQGGGIVNFVLNDTELSKEYRIRVITRDVNSEKAKQLKEKVDIVQGDTSDRVSLEKALAGVHTVFSVTVPSFGPDAFDAEYNAGKTIVDVAVEQGVSYIIFSTLPAVNEISRGRYTKSLHCDSKAAVEKHIRSLNIKCAFISLGTFMENFIAFPFLGPFKADDGTYFNAFPHSPDTKLPWIDVTDDIGKFVGAILAEPDKYEGKTFATASALYSHKEVAAILSKSTGKTVVYKQVSAEEFKGLLPFAQDSIYETFMFCEEFDYFGPNAKEEIAWAIANARGKMTSLEEFLERYPLHLS